MLWAQSGFVRCQRSMLLRSAIRLSSVRPPRKTRKASSISLSSADRVFNSPAFVRAFHWSYVIRGMANLSG